MNHRQNGWGGLRSDRRQTLGDLAFAGIVLCLGLMLYIFAARQDAIDEVKHARLAQAERAQLAIPVDIRDAYERGMVDAYAAMKETPDGIALLQACLANGYSIVEVRP